MTSLPRVAWCSPLPTAFADSAAAYLTAEICPRLTAFETTLFSTQPGNLRDFAVKDYRELLRLHLENPYDIIVCNVERTTAVFCQQLLRFITGTVILHDLNFLPQELGDIEKGAAWEELAQEAQRLGYPRRSLNEIPGEVSRNSCEFECQHAAALVFTSERNRREYSQKEDHCPRRLRPRVYTISIPAAISTGAGRPADGTRCPVKFGSSVKFVGSLQDEFRTHKVLPAVAACDVDFTWLVSTQEKTGAEELVRRAGLTRCRVVEGRNPDRWRTLVTAGDITIHTLYSAYSEPAPYLQISLAAGAACIVSDFSGPGLLPQEVAIKIAPGSAETLDLTFVIKGLLADEQYRVRLGTNARNYAAEFCDPRFVADELTAVLHESLMRHSVPI